jgi:hypothetical protein
MTAKSFTCRPQIIVSRQEVYDLRVIIFVIEAIS